MSESILIGKPSPFCPGCGHQVVTNDLARAFQQLDLDPLDIILVSDIGCCGLVDGLVGCHTIHGLHGRAPALALGVSLGLDNPDKKVIVIQGDGGATIGLQHILEAARQNVDLTLIVENNMVYGMTGGQISGLSSLEFKAVRMPDARDIPPYDLCELTHTAGAAFSARVFVGGKIAETLQTAIATPGFSMVEIVDMCPSHGVRKVKELKTLTDYPETTLCNTRPPAAAPHHVTESLLKDLHVITPEFESLLKKRLGIIIAGSAGEGIQLSGDLLATAAVSAGLHATKKGEYPITVGTGFSIAEVILSREPIHYTGIEIPDVVFIVSHDGYEKIKQRIDEKTIVIADSTLEIEGFPRLAIGEFRKGAGKKGAALTAIRYWLDRQPVFPGEALEQAARRHKFADNLMAAINSAEKIKQSKIPFDLLP